VEIKISGRDQRARVDPALDTSLLNSPRVAIEVAIRSEAKREFKTAFEADKASVSHLNFSRLRNGLLIQATLRTTRYVETGALHSFEDTLRKKFGPDTKLLIDQILVTQAEVTAAQAAQAQNPIPVAL